jgi:hypothetical protein
MDGFDFIICRFRSMPYFCGRESLLGDAYCPGQTDDEQLSLLDLTEEACHHVKTQLKNGKETSAFPANPVHDGFWHSFPQL